MGEGREERVGGSRCGSKVEPTATRLPIGSKVA